MNRRRSASLTRVFAGLALAGPRFAALPFAGLVPAGLVPAALVPAALVPAALVLAGSAGPPAFAQDPAAVAPGLSSVAFRNDRVRVLRNRYPPHQEIPVHSHPARLVIPIVDGTARSIATDGTAREVRLEAGRVTWIEPQTHAVANPTDAPLDIVEVEFMNAGERGVAVVRAEATAPADAAPAGAAAPSPAREPGPEGSESIPVEADPFHRIVFENQYVRVLELRLPPGATSSVHRHALDVLEVPIGGGSLATQRDGDGAWSAPLRHTPGSVHFAPDASAPRTRRVRNAGATEYRALLLQLLPAAARHAR